MTYHTKGCRALIVALFIVSIVLTGCAFPASDEPDPPAEAEAARKLLVAAHGDEHRLPTAPRRVRAVYRLISHTLELRVTPPKHFGTNASGHEAQSVRRYEYQVNGGSWRTLTGATCLSWSTWQDGWASGAACLAEDVMMLIAQVPITATGRVAYGVRAIGDSPGGVKTVYVTIAEPGEDAPSQVIQRPVLVLNEDSGELNVNFQLDDVRVNHQNTIEGVHINLYSDGQCANWIAGAGGPTRMYGDRNVSITVQGHPDGLNAREVGLRIRHRTPAWGECVRVRRS